MDDDSVSVEKVVAGNEGVAVNVMVVIERITDDEGLSVG